MGRKVSWDRFFFCFVWGFVISQGITAGISIYVCAPSLKDEKVWRPSVAQECLARRSNNWLLLFEGTKREKEGQWTTLLQVTLCPSVCMSTFSSTWRLFPRVWGEWGGVQCEEGEHVVHGVEAGELKPDAFFGVTFHLTRTPSPPASNWNRQWRVRHASAAAIGRLMRWHPAREWLIGLMRITVSKCFFIPFWLAMQQICYLYSRLWWITETHSLRVQRVHSERAGRLSAQTFATAAFTCLIHSRSPSCSVFSHQGEANWFPLKSKRPVG